MKLAYETSEEKVIRHKEMKQVFGTSDRVEPVSNRANINKRSCLDKASSTQSILTQLTLCIIVHLIIKFM